MKKTVSAVIFDLDGTLTRVPSPWQYIHQRLGLWENTASLHLDDWLAGRIDYEEFCVRDTSLWKGRSVDEIQALLDEIVFNKHVPAIVERLVGNGIPSIIISSGFRYVAAKIQARCDWQPLLIYANELVDGPDVRIRVSADPRSPISKKALADDALQLVDSVPGQTLVVSDSTRDLEQLGHCGYQLLVDEEDDLFRVTEFL